MSTKMQRLFSLMMAVLMMLSLTACGGNATSSTPASVSGSGSESGEQVSEAAKRLEEQKELNIMFVAGNFAESMQKIYADYEKEYGVKINYTILGVDTYFQKMLVEMSSESDAYDLIYLMSPQFLQYASNDWLYPLDDLIADKSITDDALLDLDGSLQWTLNGTRTSCTAFRYVPSPRCYTGGRICLRLPGSIRSSRLKLGKSCGSMPNCCTRTASMGSACVARAARAVQKA